MDAIETDTALATDTIDTALASAAASVNRYAEASVPESTRRAYNRDWQRFEAWMDEHGLVALPAREETVAAYVAHLADAGRKPSTIDRALASIRKAHRLAGHEAPTGDKVAAVRRGVRRTTGTAQKQAQPILVADLRAMCAALDETIAGLRDRALLLVGFCGAFRRSELVGLDASDVDLTSEGAVVMLRHSKTDQEGEGRRVGLPHGRTAETCPVRALQAWLDASGVTSGPIFRGVNRHGQVGTAALTGHSVARIVKRAAEAAGLDTTRVSGHSLRAGLATSAAMAGASERSIMAQTGHTSTTMVRRYIRDGQVFCDNAAAGLL